MKSFAKMNNISKLDLKKLNENFSLDIIKTDKIFKSKDDDTVKILYKLDGGYLIEMSTIEFESGYSGCITTQVGCNMGCKFCASGLNKKKRNLETFEIVQQFLYANEYLEKNNLRKLNSTSFMGIGEPLDNFENLVQAIKIMHEPKGINLG
jgi:23S rRNA (adenine2503-C2)-methyltransferase